MRRSVAWKSVLIAGMICPGLAALVPSAQAAQFVARSVRFHNVHFKVDGRDRGILTYTAHGVTRHVILWGGRNAKPPNPAHPNSQSKLRRDYSGGYGAFGRAIWKHRNRCGVYTGPALSYPAIAKCTMANGTNWVVQRWHHRLMPNGGFNTCTGPLQCTNELWVSHFTSDAMPQLWLKFYYTVRATWRGVHLDGLYGRLSYRGIGAYGFSSTRTGAPRDSFGRLVYVDTYNSRWGSGWRRENSFLTHSHSDGGFCDVLWPNRFGRKNSPGSGQTYRAIANGPGVTPIVEWHGPPPGNYGLSNPQTRAGLANYPTTGTKRQPYDAANATALEHEKSAILAPSTLDSCHHNW